MSQKFDNKEIVQYDDPYFGKGKGVVVGIYKNENIEMYVIYPKTAFDYSFWPYMTFLVSSDKLISTPF